MGQAKNTIQLSRYLPTAMFRRLKRLSAQTRVRMAAYVEEAIGDLLKKHRRTP